MNNSIQQETNETRDWNSLFERFIEEKQHLLGVTPRTIQSYRDAWKAFEKYGKPDVSERGVKDFMIAMSKSEMKPVSANTFATSINSFLTWLFENDLTNKRLRVPKKKVPKRTLDTYTKDEVEKIVSFVPTLFSEKRLMALMALLVDNGARINEALTLERSKIDFDNGEVKLWGKGQKERTVPISPECGEIIRRWLKEHNHNIVFCAINGKKIRYDNLRGDFVDLLEKVGVEKSEGSFHAFRRYFSREYVRNGGNLFHLQQMLGHTTLEMSRRYTKLDIDDLKKMHQSASPLANLYKLRKNGRRQTGKCP